MKLIFLIICLFGVCYLGYQLYAMSESRLETEAVRTVAITEAVTSEGIFFRGEQLLTRDEGGVYELLVGEWEKVSRNQEVAVLYSDGGDYALSLELRDLEQRLEQLRGVQESGKESASPAAINAAIYSSIYQTSGMSVEGGFAGLADLKSQLISGLLNRESSFTGDNTVGNMIERLEAEYNSLKRSPAGIKTTVRVTAPGVFSSGVDGYESIFDPADIVSATPEEFSLLLEKSPEAVNEGGLIGKLIRGNRWYFATLLPEQEAKRLISGTSYEILFHGGDGKSVEAGLTRLTQGKDGRYLAVFSSEYNMQNIARMRKTECEIVLRVYEGLRVPKRAVRLQDGVEGVYCLAGTQARFKPITRLYEVEDYYVCESDLTSVRQLFLYDEIIVSGKNLFDGKIVK